MNNKNKLLKEKYKIFYLFLFNIQSGISCVPGSWLSKLGGNRHGSAVGIILEVVNKTTGSHKNPTLHHSLGHDNVCRGDESYVHCTFQNHHCLGGAWMGVSWNKAAGPEIYSGHCNAQCVEPRNHFRGGPFSYCCDRVVENSSWIHIIVEVVRCNVCCILASVSIDTNG